MSDWFLDIENFAVALIEIGIVGQVKKVRKLAGGMVWG